MNLKSIGLVIAVFGAGLFVGHRMLPMPQPSYAQDPKAPGVATGSTNTPVAPPKNNLAIALEAVQASVGMDSPRRQAHMDAALSNLSLADIPAALAAIERVPFQDVRAEQLEVLLRRWGYLDGPAAVAFAGGMQTRLRTHMTLAALEGWSRADKWAAAEWVIALPESNLRAVAIQSITQELASDPDRALAWLQQADPRGKLFYAAHPLFSAWAGRDPAAAAQAALALTGRTRSQAIFAVAWKWGETDPRAALAWVDSLPGDKRRAALETVLNSWSSRDPSAAAQFALSLNDRQLRDQFVQMVSGSWAEQDPTAALAWVQTVDDPVLRDQFITGMFPAWAGENPQDALQYVQSLPPGSQRDLLYRNWAEAWVNKSPEAAVKWARDLPPGKLRQDVCEAMALNVAHSDPEQAIVLFREMHPGPRRQALVTSIIGPLSEEDPSKAVSFIQSLSGPEKIAAQSGYISQRVHEDPASTAAVALSSGWITPETARQIAEIWSQRDLEAARVWIAQLPGSAERDKALSGLAASWARTDSSAAATYALSLPEGEVRADFLKNIAEVLGTRGDAMSAAAWWSRLPPGESKDQALTSMVGALVENSPVSAASMVGSLPPGDEQTRAAVDVSARWSASDPAAAAAWAARFPDGRARQEALETVLAGWGYNDSTEAARFLDTLPAGASRDSAASGFVSAIAEHNPALAGAYALGISDPDRKTTAVEQVARAWMSLSPAQAEQWINSAPLNEEARDRIRSTVVAAPAPPPVFVP